MKNSKISERVTELRNRKGFSQEVLAEESGLSLRTIQRIENGETTPRGDTLQRIAKGLSVTSEEIIDWKLEKNDSYLAMLNTSALSFLIFPLLGILIPLVMWISQKNKIHGIDRSSRKILNFQITWSLVLFLSIIGYIGGNFYRVNQSSLISPSLLINPLYLWGTIVLLYFINLVLVVINSVRLKSGKNVSYFLGIPFLK
ncbi:helix-turn-helix domain-containing protein [Zunongwangia atlantica]|uniref:Transcriptional regulator, XRE family protein n=1 Tax=Zunongwangia atlantica 22II14-10F7 TaxID=1185767 RepID=A0A1Y1T3B7_9FLAO|nr:helix-turn-helix domain-containing protein [Zunongwangia atlantica]ORL45531.1 transcriptional regulator, XRE family protein [Zunongwangia atlantica 22II14-10F7]